jgi:hypothetical protein
VENLLREGNLAAGHERVEKQIGKLNYDTISEKITLLKKGGIFFIFYFKTSTTPYAHT